MSNIDLSGLKAKCHYCGTVNSPIGGEPTKGVGGKIEKVRVKFRCTRCGRSYDCTIDYTTGEASREENGHS